MPLLDRESRQVVTHRIGFGLPGPPPKRLDYWIITRAGLGDERVEFDHEATEALRELGYAPPRTREWDGSGQDPEPVRPRKLPIRVDSDDIDDFLTQSYRMRFMRPLVDKDGRPVLGRDGKPRHEAVVGCHGDGVNAQRLQKDRTWAAIPCCSRPVINGKGFQDRPLPDLVRILRGQQRHDPNDGLRCPYAQNSLPAEGPVCSPETVLICRCDAIGSLGTFARYRSHGHRTADRLRSSLEEIKHKLGFLADVPLDIAMTKVTIRMPNGKSTGMQVAHVELRLSYDETMRIMESRLRQRLSLGQAYEETRRLLAAARREDDSPARIAAEFSPTAPASLVDAEGNGGMQVQEALFEELPSVKEDPALGDR